MSEYKILVERDSIKEMLRHGIPFDVVEWDFLGAYHIEGCYWLAKAENDFIVTFDDPAVEGLSWNIRFSTGDTEKTISFDDPDKMLEFLLELIV